MGVMNMCLFSGEMEPSPDNEQRQMIIVANSKVVHFDAHLSSINSKGNFSRRSQSMGLSQRTLPVNAYVKCRLPSSSANVVGVLLIFEYSRILKIFCTFQTLV